ncbi:uncharacterized protein CANTADRAFT_31061 [Suhomyces tanzawaensis NRRL Y-17324]
MSRRSGRSKAYADPNETNEFPEEDETNNYEAEPEDEVEDELEVTRCVCALDELTNSMVNPQLGDVLNKEYHIRIDQGLFIQCDKCSVWQHGYCVGLFTNDEVPEKYWCELCKPDLHIFIYENNEVVRTLYRPVNDKRKKLLIEDLAAGQLTSKTARSRSKRLAASSASPSAAPGDPKASRKERRHYDESYDEQLQKALRESAKESGIPLSSEVKKSESNEKSNSHKKVKTENDLEESENNEQDPSNLEEDRDDETDPKSSETVRKSKPRGSRSNGKSKAHSAQNATPLSKDELTNQASKPRFVSDKSSIYELRKRTGAILEWLGRSQIELEEEKLNKIELFSYKDSETDSQIIVESGSVIKTFDENLKLMESLTEKILNWEQKFGKYAP